MKLHRRDLRAGGRTWTVLTPRPGLPVGFSTNRFHETWHVITDPRGAGLLARLLWGLAFQRRPGTLVLLHGALLRGTPFDADPSDPIVLVNARLGIPDASTLKALRERLPSRSQGTLRWQTWGLDAPCDWETDFPWWRPERRDETITRRGGCLVYAAPPSCLRLTARLAQTLSSPSTLGTDYQFLVRRDDWPQGELQTFDDYRTRVSVAAEARRDVLAGSPPRDPQGLREAVWGAAAAVRRRRRGGTRRRAAAGAAG